VADSVVDICNAAMVALGEDPIVSLNDTTKRASLCALRYDCVRQGVLRSHLWSCARGRAQLPALATAPPFGYQTAFQLPADCLRLFELEDDETWDWVVEGQQVLCNCDPPLNIIYVRDLTDTTVMDAMLRDVIALELAVDLCQPLAQSADKQKLIQARLDDVRAKAQTASAQEISPREWDEDIWLRSRR